MGAIKIKGKVIGSKDPKIYDESKKKWIDNPDFPKRHELSDKIAQLLHGINAIVVYEYDPSFTECIAIITSHQLDKIENRLQEERIKYTLK